MHIRKFLQIHCSATVQKHAVTIQFKSCSIQLFTVANHYLLATCIHISYILHLYTIQAMTPQPDYKQLLQGGFQQVLVQMTSLPCILPGLRLLPHYAWVCSCLFTAW